MKKWESVTDITTRAKSLENLQIREIVSEGTLQKYYKSPKNKGWMGQAIESDGFYLKNNSSKFADFEEMGVELKVTPIKKVKKGWSAKERLVLNIFDFEKEHLNSFEDASFLMKADLIQIVYYEHVVGKEVPDFEIKRTYLLSIKDLPPEDLLIIQQDWELIVQMIRDGKADELSDSLTKYLAATTKGSKTENNMRVQPFSSNKAHQRSFTLKTKYMSFLANQIMNGNYDEVDYVTRNKEVVTVIKPRDILNEQVIPELKDLKEKSFEQNIIDILEHYVGMKKSELGLLFDIDIPKADDKASTSLIVKSMLQLKGDIDEVKEFIKSGISPRSVVINSYQFKKPASDRKTKEGFKLLSPINIVEESKLEWNESSLYEYLLETPFLLFVFLEENNDLIFKGVKFWSLPGNQLDTTVKGVWMDTKQTIKEGVQLNFVKANNKKGYRVFNNLIPMSADRIIHVRPDSGKSSYSESSLSVKLPTKSAWTNRPEHLKGELTDHYITKQAFWFNPKFIYKQVKELVES